MPPKPILEIQVIEAHAEAMAFAFRSPVRCLEDRRALEPAQFDETLRIDMALRREDESDMTLAMLSQLRTTLMEQARKGQAPEHRDVGSSAPQ